MQKNRNTRKMIQISMLSVISFLMMYLVEFPLLPAAPFLKYDPSQVPTLIAAFAFGPLAGVVAELLKSFLFFISGKSTAGIVGVSAAFVAGGAFVFTSGIIYRMNKTRKNAVVALAAGTVVMTVVMTLANYFVFFPLWGIPSEQVAPMLLSAVVPFNLVKGALSSLLTFLLYKKVHKLLD